MFEIPALFPLLYICTIFVAFQGVAIFVIFVPLSKQVREAYSKWWKVKVAESDILSRHFGDWSFNRTSLKVLVKGTCPNYLWKISIIMTFGGEGC